MSKLIDRLNEIGRAAPQPIGFGKALSAARRPRLALIARIEPVSIGGLAGEVAGADAALLSMGRLVEGGNFGEISRVIGDIPWGVYLNGGDIDKLEELTRNGCDFVVFLAEEMSLSLAQHKAPGKILEVGASLPDGLLRTINQMPADAVLVHREEKSSSLTWYDLMLFRHDADLLTKPLLVPVPEDVADKELLTLWEAGVDAIVVPAGGPGRTVKELRTEIDKLSFPRERGAGRRDVVLPALGGQAVREEQEEEEEEDE